MLRLLVGSAHLPAATGAGPGVHVYARFRGVPRSTRVVPAERSPTWNETLVWPLAARPLRPTDSLALRLQLWGQPDPRRLLGATMVSLHCLAEDPGLPLDLGQLPLQDSQGHPTGATISLRCSYVPPGQVAAGNATSQRSGVAPWLSPPRPTPAVGAAIGMAPRRHPKPAAGKKEDFQVRVRVLEGHQLQGSAIKPVVVVLIGEQRFRSRIRAGNNPYYNEVFSQHFHLTPAQLAAVPIHIQVLNSRAIRADAIIGAFKLDVGTIYNAPGRRLSGKWLSLQHPRHPDAGCCGYLRISAAVLRAGETVLEQEDIAGSQEVEANLLQPALLAPCMATLQLHIYHAEELPQEEPSRSFPAGSKRSFVAAAVRASFAGRTLCTRVMPPSAKPTWNEVFFFPLRLPPLCDAIELAILSGSKVLGTATLHLSHISSAGAELEGGVPGFLPCFGPSFLPFYGPKRDAASKPTDTTVAYRGRVLLELSTQPGDNDGRQQDTIAPEDITRAQRLLPPRHRLGLCAVFYSATMLSPTSEPLRFELSIGNHGDTGDTTGHPTACATPQGHPLFDGNRYYYMPWHNNKPVVAVSSMWEDAGQRWDGQNLLHNVGERLERNVAMLRNAKPDAHGDIGRKLLRELARDCRAALPVLQAQHPKTQLDMELHAARLHLLQHLASAAITRPLRRAWAALLPEAEAWLSRVAALQAEPQAGVPDVFLWLRSGTRRLACARIPAHCMACSPHGPAACGRLCGRTHTLMLGTPGHLHAQLRVRLWLGRVSESQELPRYLEAPLHVYAETYENQMKVLGKWSRRALPGHPSFSDVVDRAGLPRERIRTPQGWCWDGTWDVEPPQRLLPDHDAGVDEVLEEVYENQSRQHGGEWGPATVPSTDVTGTAVPPKEEVVCPQGWHVTDDWRVEVTGAVDEAGWEYGVSAAAGDPSPAWHPKEETYHTQRRRRWLRTRRRDSCAQGQEKDTDVVHSPEAPDKLWEYASLWGSRFHPQRRVGDACRRRCWHRRMVPETPSSVAAIFLLDGTADVEATPESKQTAAVPKGRGHLQHPKPVILCTFQRPSSFQLRCYLFQALELKPHGTKTKADPVAHVSFVHLSQSTRVLPGTLDPVWDQALLFHRVPLHGDPRGVQEEPPAVVVEVFDQDGEGAGSFLGRSVCTPNVWLDVGHWKPPRLQRYPLEGPGGPAGELLAAFELLHETEDGAVARLSTPPWRQGTFSIPPGIRPVLRLMALEVLAWGLRGLRGRSVLPVRAPSLEVQCGGQVLRIPPITNLTTNPNFPINAFLLTLHLPMEEEYMPPIRLRVLDTLSFGYRPHVGQACVQDLARFRREPNAGEQLHTPRVPVPGSNPAAAWGRIAQMLPRVTAEKGTADKDMEREEEDEEEGDWWSKFYMAMGDTAKSHRGTRRDSLKVYSCELEAVPEFQGLQDFCQTFPLYQPGGQQGDDPVGEFKGLFCLYPFPEDPGVPPPPRHFQELPPSHPQQCLVRVYIVRAFDLSPRDRNGMCDPYVRVSLGAKTLGQRDQYVPNTVEPVFGRMFEMMGTVPLEKDLRVSLLDHDRLPPDQEIGSTTIDLENRLLSRFRAHCGLPRLYRTAGPGRWRDQLSPSRALEHLAHTRGLQAPEFNAEGTAVTFGGSTFRLSHFESGPPTHRHPGAPRERLALHVMRAWKLVPEHLETRTLYNSAQPGLEQGKLQMWVDIFPSNLGPPGPPVDISPRKPQSYELRCVVWNTRDVEPGDISATGQRLDGRAGGAEAKDRRASPGAAGRRQLPLAFRLPLPVPGGRAALRAAP
ncbi:fer-1-like protein 5 isoform X2 [Coturnix japonica]|uniref:fer-1-like protein 5 isoform X2 n=1 Tax=Coturnix japonica TaxID=93934 RepID=UPI000777C0DB|nr:fer-1-like protein 5 isoform X2 [Coturnix japonica]